MLVKRLVMNRRKTEAVARMQANRCVLIPWHDVAGNQKAFVADSGYTTAITVAAQYRAAKEGLADTLLHQRRAHFACEIPFVLREDFRFWKLLFPT